MFVMIGILLFSSIQLYAQTESFVKSTYPFSVKDGQTLSLDLYTSSVSSGEEKALCYFYVWWGICTG